MPAPGHVDQGQRRYRSAAAQSGRSALVLAWRSYRSRMAEPAAVIEQAKPYFVGVEFEPGYVGHDIREDGDDAVLMFRDLAAGRVLGVRFPKPALPLEGVAHRGVWMRTPRDWILDLRIVLGEEIATRVLWREPPSEHAGWTEFGVAPERWPGTEGTIVDWGD